MSEESPQKDALVLASESLSKKELYAYQSFQANPELKSLAPSFQAKLFELYLNGTTCEEILRLNPALTLGQVVAAKVSGDWDRRLQEYRDGLLQGTMVKVQQTTLESASFICELLNITNRENSERIKRYLLSGNVEDLGDIQITGLAGYGKAVELLQKLTGQDKQQKVQISGEVTHKQGEAPQKPPTPQQAAEILRLLISENVKSND